ncbi:MAG: hypothetical protein QOH56_1773 [Pseudonocardiales bacterium]|jgi:hypothetical protein|nr:hypothetical protein [Pseudonocardiales bacterium]
MSDGLHAEIAAEARRRAKRLLGMGFAAAAAELESAAVRLEGPVSTRREPDSAQFDADELEFALGRNERDDQADIEAAS